MLAVVQNVVKPDLGIALPCRPDRFECDVVKAPIPVAARGISLRRCSVVPGIDAKSLDHLQETPGRADVAHVLQDIGLGADQLVCFGEVRTAALAEDEFRDMAGKSIARHAGERVRSAALQRDLEV